MSEAERLCATGTQFKSHLQSLLLRNAQKRISKLSDVSQDQGDDSESNNNSSNEPSHKQTITLSLLAELTSRAPSSLLLDNNSGAQQSPTHEQKSEREDFKSKLSQLLGNRRAGSSATLAKNAVLPSRPSKSFQGQDPTGPSTRVEIEVAEDDILEAIQASFANISVIGNEITVKPIFTERMIKGDDNLSLHSDCTAIVEVAEQLHSVQAYPEQAKCEDQLVDQGMLRQRLGQEEPNVTDKQEILAEISSTNDSVKKENVTCLIELAAASEMMAVVETGERSSRYWQAECIRLAKEIRDMEIFEANLILLLDRFPKSDVLQMLRFPSQQPLASKSTSLFEDNPSKSESGTSFSVYVISAFTVLFILLSASWVLEKNVVGSCAGLFLSS